MNWYDVEDPIVQSVNILQSSNLPILQCSSAPLAPPPAHAERLRGPRVAIVVPSSTLVAGGIVVRYGFAVNKLSRGIGQTMFYGADGKPWFPLEEHRRDVPLTRISAYLRDAVVAVEDHRFHSHLGIDPIGIGRAVVRDVRAGGLEEGGSTLTQQLARTLFLTASRGDWTRKGKEAVLALMIEQRLSKPQILELYLNRIYLGGNVYGVEAMSQNVFGKTAADLTLSEAAFIAGLIRMPSALWPWSHYDRAAAAQPRRPCSHARRRVHHGAGRAAGARDAAPHPRRSRPESRGRRLRAGLSSAAIQGGVRRRQPARLEGADDVRAGAADERRSAPSRRASRNFARPDCRPRSSSIDPHTGDVLALVGGRDFRRTPFNRAIGAKRQPGSAFKPFRLCGRARKRHVSDFAGLEPHTICASPATTNGK